MGETDSESLGLTIVIPALNEEEAIADIVERCLAERSALASTARLSRVDVVVVSDGSVDRTSEIAQSYDEVRTIVFQEHQGYGAAIKAGFRVASGGIVGFLDADGTCDPAMFANMCRQLQANDVDMVLGSRLGPDSQMPIIRRVGNRIFAVILSLLTNKTVTDCASGMRVMWKHAFERLEPLPNGLHFTPAMSAKALMSGMHLIEIPIPYAKRVGESKLNVFRDGIRFLRAIIEGLLYFAPSRGFAMVGWLTTMAALLLAVNPVEHYLSAASLEEWMIYRFIACYLLGTIAALSFSYYALVSRMIELGPGSPTSTFWGTTSIWLFRGRIALVASSILMLGSIALVSPGIVEYLRTTTVSLHWSRVVVAAFGALLSFQILATHLVLRVIDLWLERRVVERTRSEAAA